MNFLPQPAQFGLRTKLTSYPSTIKKNFTDAQFGPNLDQVQKQPKTVFP